MGANGENNILDLLDKLSDKDIIETFINKIIPIYEHSKEDITEVLKSKSVQVLKQLREALYSELVLKLPEFAEREPLTEERLLALLKIYIYLHFQ